jgi:hypothetical protein
MALLINRPQTTTTTKSSVSSTTTAPTTTTTPPPPPTPTTTTKAPTTTAPPTGQRGVFVRWPNKVNKNDGVMKNPNLHLSKYSINSFL